MADEIKMTRSQGPSRPSSRYWTAAVGIRSSTASTVPRTIAISALVAWSPTWATLGCVGGSWVDASVVQVVRWQGAGALAGWAPSERRQRRPTCRLGGGGARLGFTDVPWTGRLPDRERSGRGDGHRGRLVVELRHDVRRVLADPTDGVRVEHEVGQRERIALPSRLASSLTCGNTFTGFTGIDSFPKSCARS